MANKNLKEILKAWLIIISVIIIIDIWIIWESKDKIAFDYSFITKEKNTIDATVFSMKEIETEEEVSNGNSTRTNVYNGFIYFYKFTYNGKEYSGKDYSFNDTENTNTISDIPYKMKIEFIKDEPEMNRIIGFSFINDWYSFFKEYFLIKMVILLIVIINSIVQYKDAQHKQKKSI